MSKTIIESLKASIESLKYDLINKPMDEKERLNKVLSIDKISEAINLLEETLWQFMY